MTELIGLPLIAPKPFAEYSPDEYHAYVSEMYSLRKKAGKTSVVPGLSVSRTKAGKLSIRKTAARAFPYVTYSELAKLAEAAKVNQSDLWQVFQAKKYIITQTRMEAEVRYAAEPATTAKPRRTQKV